jgi:hypothetical protein
MGGPSTADIVALGKPAALGRRQPIDMRFEVRSRSGHQQGRYDLPSRLPV